MSFVMAFCHLIQTLDWTASSKMRHRLAGSCMSGASDTPSGFLVGTRTDRSRLSWLQYACGEHIFLGSLRMPSSRSLVPHISLRRFPKSAVHCLHSHHTASCRSSKPRF